MRCKIARIQKLMWRNIMRLTKNKKVLVLHYSIDIYRNIKLKVQIKSLSCKSFQRNLKIMIFSLKKEDHFFFFTQNKMF